MSLTFSNSPLWSNCAVACTPGAVQQRELADAFVSLLGENPDAIEGQAAHWVAKCVLHGTAAAEELIGKVSPGGWTVNEVMARHVQGYVDTFAGRRVHAEQELSCFNGAVNGRADSVISDHEHILYVSDLKYGYRIHEPQHSPQLLLPAIAMRQAHHTIFHLSIYQPRVYHPDGPYRKWVIGAGDIDAWADRLFQACCEAYSTSVPATPGQWCEYGYCPKAGSCPALTANLGRLYEVLTSSRRPRPTTPAEIGAHAEWLDDMAPLLKAATRAAEAEITTRIRAHREFVPGWTMGPSEGNREWTAPLATRRLMFGALPVTEEVELTPAKMEDLGANKDVVAAMSARRQKGAKLARFNVKKAEKVFGK